MKAVFTQGVVILAIMGMVGCSTNTQSQNTGIGAATGAVVGGLAGSLFGQGTGKAVAVGVGAVAGALLGGYIGHSMDSSDKAQCSHALSHNASQQSSQWKNKNTGMSYNMTPTSNMMAYQGNPNCRRYTTTATNNDGKSQTSSGVACRQANGDWLEMKS